MDATAWFAWLQFLQALALTYATSEGKDARALGYLNVALTLASTPRVTAADLYALMDEYKAKVANNVPTTAAELEELDQRLAALSQAIQAT